MKSRMSSVSKASNASKLKNVLAKVHKPANQSRLSETEKAVSEVKRYMYENEKSELREFTRSDS